MECNFLSTIKWLQKNSEKSVDGLSEFSEYTEYLHADRTIQSHLEDILRQSKDSSSKKLVLLCGSAGDGKSHILSYLKNKQKEQLLKGFEINNDATESDDPQRHATETLSRFLDPFCDANLENGNNEKAIVAINLGMLTRFIHSDFADGFGALKEYVEEEGILTEHHGKNDYDGSSHFQTLNFSDFQPFELTQDGAKASFITQIMDKVFSAAEGNPFRSAFDEHCGSCLHSSYCPVRANYLFLSDISVRKVMLKRLIGVILADRPVITARNVLDFVFESMVSPHFNIENLSDLRANGGAEFPLTYICQTTPILMFESERSESLIGRFASHDILVNRQAGLDDLAVRYQVSERVYQKMREVAKDTPYSQVVDSVDYSVMKNDADPMLLKNTMFRFLVRLCYLIEKTDEICPGSTIGDDSLLDEYLHLLFFYNTNNLAKLRDLRKSVEKAIRAWDGDYPAEGFSLLAKYGNYDFCQKIDLEYQRKEIEAATPQPDGSMSRFRPTITLGFRPKGFAEGKTVHFEIDYPLYLLLKSMEEGYQPTIAEKNMFTSFSTSYEELVSQQRNTAAIYVVNREVDKRAVGRFVSEDGMRFFEVIDR